MKKIYFTITATDFHLGAEVFKRRQKVYLKKDKHNEYDHEAIAVELPGLGIVGYVANSVRTVLGKSYSAGRLYDKFKKKAAGRVAYITEKGVICEFLEK
ncbi:MAG: HIRAN domain-containing protein [Acidaminococcus sp.]|jgi:hypothetical protein|nr:HIRAN domain-containing protein [Acidaminococcus sp.]MCI2099581.1 HIRAN domain-containing protein [Acidaminococcus sp.]MCI2113666.1 HIRAN domain-containing protein [Acidaminococcus sp.]MCI2115749.1 HIRAN domain-containing protein [Acidaminococcus sp.]